MDAPSNHQSNESVVQVPDVTPSRPTGRNSRRPRRPRPNRDSASIETTVADFQSMGTMHHHRRPHLPRGSAQMQRPDADLGNYGRLHEPDFRNQGRLYSPVVRPLVAQVRTSLPQEALWHGTRSDEREMHTGRNFPSQDAITLGHLRLDTLPSHRQQRSMESVSSQNVRPNQFVNLPSQDVRRIEQLDYENSSRPFGEQRRNGFDRRQLRGAVVGDGGSGREQDRRRGGDRQSREGVVQRQRPFGESMSQRVDASREAVAEALQGLSVNGNPGTDSTETLRGNTRNSTERENTRGLAERERWRRRSNTNVGPLQKTCEFSGATDSMIGRAVTVPLLPPGRESTMNEKSSIPTLVQELVDKLDFGKVECMICYDMVNINAPIWSCGSCYSIFHLSCIRKWARAPTSVDMSVPMPRHAPGSNWRCPGCQAVQFVSAAELRSRCFCGQVVDPSVDLYITPHSCGGPCRKSLNKGKDNICKHICTMQCHPGPCPPCTALTPPQACPCGKTSYVRRCSEQNSVNNCGQPCGRQLHCERHYCDKICHEGPCGQCDVLLAAKCFCGQKEDSVSCGSISLKGDIASDTGAFPCGGTCSKLFECGKHRCMKQCHPGKCGDCDFAPWRIQTCPCGKKTLHELLGSSKQRNSCSDPVPLCGQGCEKLLPCEMHTCPNLCHTGPCSPCTVLVEEKCRCGCSTRTAPCYRTSASGVNITKSELEGQENYENLFLCNRKCGKKKSCGRHRCNNLCCPLTDSGSHPLGAENSPHICLLACGKKLRCGQHTCQETCHNGHCPSCLETIFTELTCACGRTSIPPPVPCGTPLPSCQFPCAVSQHCGHPATHTCHFGECPPCTVLSAKECVGNHVILRNVPCGSRDIKCNKLCGKTRQCGLHACSRTCHPPPCDVPCASDDSGIERKSCEQLCGASRRDCQHTCISSCHPSAPCPDNRCKFPVKITCSCSRLSAEVPCDAGDFGRGDAIAEAASIAKLPARLQPVEDRVRVPLGQRKLACDDDCAKLEKRRIIADAFGVNTATTTESTIAIEAGIAGSEALSEMARREPQWVMSVEDRFKYLVLGTKTPTSGPIRVHIFCSLPKERRDVIRQLAERWNLRVNMVGREPGRFLTVNVTIKTKVPIRTLIGRAPLPHAGQAHSPSFNAAIDMDPRLVVGLFDLPREADIKSLILRFGGECELVWLNDKNALAIFADAARASTALRRVDCASAYHGAVTMPQLLSGSTSRGWGANDSVTSTKGTSRRKNVHESSWVEDAWGDDWARSSQQLKPAWHGKEVAITATSNPWGALEQADTRSDSASESLKSSILATSVSDTSTIKTSTTASRSRENNVNKNLGGSHVADAADDWEEAFS